MMKPRVCQQCGIVHNVDVPVVNGWCDVCRPVADQVALRVLSPKPRAHVSPAMERQGDRHASVPDRRHACVRCRRDLWLDSQRRHRPQSAPCVMVIADAEYCAPCADRVFAKRMPSAEAAR